MHYTESHEWVSVKDQIATVGITDYAQKELGEVVYIELPKIGQQIKSGEEICVLESTKAAADVYAPISGRVIEINEQLIKEPMLINKHAETTAWLFKVEMSNPKEISHLMSKAQYTAIIS